MQANLIPRSSASLCTGTVLNPEREQCQQLGEEVLTRMSRSAQDIPLTLLSASTWVYAKGRLIWD